MYIIELEKGVYKAKIKGDPGRTLLQENAQQFKNMHSAKIALGHLRRYRPFVSANIIYLVLDNI